MLKVRANLRNMVAIATCLAVTTMFWGCDPEDDPVDEKSSEKQITDFRFTSILPPAVGVISEISTPKTIAVEVPFGTNVTALEPTIEFSDGAEVTPVSGVAQNFTSPVKYTVTAEDNSKAEYTVTVTVKSLGENDYVFTDNRGNEVVIPYGAMSCAMRVVEFTPGSPWTSDARAMEPNAILGAPDYDQSKEINYLTLGNKGVIVLEFGVYITDGPGNDIYVFEIGPDVEATKVEVSDDLTNWIFVGNADGSLSGVDMNGKIPADGKYRYVRLTDIHGTGSSWPGADVDAVAAVHPVKIGSGNIGDVVEYTDTRGNKIKVPGGALSCATFVVDFTHGEPWTNDPRAMDAEKSLGAPDYENDENYVTLGADGVIILGFNVFITDGEGQDIYIFEIGPDVEATKVEVSNDLVNWIYVGDADGALSGVDIKGKVPAGSKYKYVRLTDLKTHPASNWTGADIDAVAVLHPALE